MKKLRNISQYRNRFIYFSLSLVSLILISYSVLYLVVAISFMWYLYKNHRDMLLVVMVLLIIFMLSFFIQSRQKLVLSQTSEVLILEKNEKEYYTQLIGRINNCKVVIKTHKKDVYVGDVFEVSGELQTPTNNTFPKGFNYKEYLLSKKIYYLIEYPNLNYKRNTFTIYKLKELVKDYIERSHPLSKDYIKTFLLASKEDVDEETLTAINEIGISHLFAVSGFHIALLVLSLKKGFSILFKKEVYIELIILVILFIYVVITSFSPSVLRASLMYLMLVINKRCKLHLSSLDILSLVMLTILIINPFSFYNVGFVLSFSVTFFILVSHGILSVNDKVESLFLVGVVSFFFTIPLILNLNHQINLLTLFFNVIFVLIMSYIILPLNYITFLFPFLDSFNHAVNENYNALIYFASKIDYFSFDGAFTSPVFVIGYYFMTFRMAIKFESRTLDVKSTLVFGLYLILCMNSNVITPTTKITYLDVYGDSILINDSFNQCNILIDTGEVDQFHSVVSYIKSENVKRLDYFIVTHYHSDHYGEKESVVEHFNVENYIDNQNVNNHLEPFLCGSMIVKFYEIEQLDKNENNNSVVTSIIIKEKHYLFTGDIENKREISLIKEIGKIDYLKVPHHGSETSSSVELIETLSPNEVFIIAHKNNKFGHPHDIILKRYERYGINVFSTSELGTIEEIYFFDFRYKKTYKR